MSPLLIPGRALDGCPVVDVNTGEDVAEIRDVVFDSASGLLTGFTLNKRGSWSGRLRAVLPVDRVSAVGIGAVMISDPDALVGGEDEAQDINAASKADAEVVDDLVVTESGQTLGTVHDVIIMGGASPRVVAFEIATGEDRTQFIPKSPHGGVSASALIVPDDYEARVRDDLAGLADQLDRLSLEQP